jgi:3-hydroxybutyryl-CoA dehydratase
MRPPAIEAGVELESVSRVVTLEDMVLFEPVGEKNIHTDHEVARAAGLPAAIAAGVQLMSYIFEMLHREYGFQSVQGTVLDVRIREPVFAGDTVTARGRVADVETDGPRSRVSLEVWCENQRGGQVIAGTANILFRGSGGGDGT